jgi:hypothetical protein
VQSIAAFEKNLLPFPLRPPVDLHGTWCIVFPHRPAFTLAPQTIRGGKNNLGYAILDGHVANISRAIHIGCPKRLFVFHDVSEHGRAVKHRIEVMTGEKHIQYLHIANIPLYRFKTGVPEIVMLQIDAHARMAPFKHYAFEYFPEESGSSGYENFHILRWKY